MGPKPNIEDGLPTHRPLPSIDLALLPHERRAIRIRYMVGASIILFVIGSGTAAYVFASDMRHFVESVFPASRAKQSEAKTTEQSQSLTKPSQQTEPEEKVPPVETPVRKAPTKSDKALAEAAKPVVIESKQNAKSTSDSETDSGNQPVVKRFGKAHGFRDAVIAAGVSTAEANELVTALTSVLDFRRCKPEHEMVLTRDQEHRLIQFEYRASVTEVYRATRNKQGKLVGRTVEIPIEKRRFAKGGYISKSLRRALETVGLGSNFAGVFVEVFEGHIDFQKDARAGDSFKAVVDHQYVNGNFLGVGTIYALEYNSQRKGKLRAFWYEPKQGRGDYYDAQGRSMQGGWLRTPVQYDHISSKFNLKRKHPILKRIIPHLGVDYATSPGTVVRAAAEGTVSFAGFRGANGNLVAIDHSNGYQTFYAHLLRITRGIRAGVKVEQRQLIGAVGSTGLSTGPHLHFAVKRNGKFLDPATQLNGPGKPLPASEESKFRRIKQALMGQLEKITLAAAPTDTETAPAKEESEDFLEGSESL
jgi:murein DD-endopeptidase MepM/ murein hydrolase activator NlpD